MPALIEPVADIFTDFPEKFGIPRQSGLAEGLEGRIVFRPEYRIADAVRGLEDFSHIWLLWQFSECADKPWSPTVRPPRLGGNKRMGVFATRSPFRPNSIGLSAVKLERITFEGAHGPVIYVSGVDIMDKTPVFDIKPYLPFADSIPKASAGFAEAIYDNDADVFCDSEVLKRLPLQKRKALYDVLKGRPVPSYHDNPDRIYAMSFAGFCVSFSVCGDKIYIKDIKKDD